MSGFKKFLLQGDLIKLAVAFIMGAAFASVVTATVTVIMDLIGRIGGTPDFSDWTPYGIHLGAWFTARVRWPWVVAVMVAFEVALALAIRDNLVLNVLMLIYPFEGILAWQSAR